MLLDILNFLLQLLLPAVLGTAVVGGLLVYLVGRRPARKPTVQPTSRPADQPTRQTAPEADAHAAQAATGRQSVPPGNQPPLQPATTAIPGPFIPAPAPASTPAPAPAPAEATALPLLADLLLVDDSAVVRAKLRRLFEPAGYRSVLARDGQEALALLSQGRYALMVTDLEMPKLDGVGLVRATLALPACAGMPILAITGHDDLQAQLNALQAVAGIYRKPWIDEDLLNHVQSLVAPSALPAEQAEQAVSAG